MAPSEDNCQGSAVPRPLIAITMGDPAGIGPEIIAAAWPQAAFHRTCRPVVYGHPEILRRAVALRAPTVKVVVVEHPTDAEPTPLILPCVPVAGEEMLRIQAGQIQAEAGRAAYEAIRAAAEAALAGKVAAVVTAPLHKEALHLAGFHYPGHTELLADLCHVNQFAMLLYLAPEPAALCPQGLAVAHATLHIALREAIAQLSVERVLEKIRLLQQFLRWLRLETLRIGVAALNPHGGEGGLFGDEEQRIIGPAVERAQSEGIDILGPLPADTLFLRASEGEFQGIVAMYHDQGHIPLKLLGMHRAVNVTMGLPIIRTSVAHGTAFDIAWQGRASERSLLHAVAVAARLAMNRISCSAQSQSMVET